MANPTDDHVRDMLVEQMEQLRRLADEIEHSGLEAMGCTVHDVIEDIYHIADKIAMRDYIALGVPPPQMLQNIPLNGPRDDFSKLAEETKARIKQMRQTMD